ncbi:MAG: AMP-binding protein [Gemmatimonadota bacterium]|nr:AMP-binding protein [Gemmatimonadota bacterium]
MAPIERSPNHTISSILARRATLDPGGTLLLANDAPVSFGDIDDQSDALAASLANLGVEPGDRIALLLPPWPEFAVSVFAAAKLGATIVPLNPRLTLPELRYMLRHSGAACAVTAETAYDTDYLQIFEDLLVELPELSHLVTVGEEDLWYDDRVFQWEDLLSAGLGRDFRAHAASPGDPFAIVYTSGTTGKPKGVELTHRGLIHAARETVAAARLESGDVVVGIGALFHVFGLGPGLIGTLLGGATLVLHDGLDARRTLELAERHGATVHCGVPTLFARELPHIRERGGAPGNLRLCLASGAPVRDDLARRIERTFGVPLLIAYSLTEASSTLAMGRLDDPPDKRTLTVGRPVADTHLRVTEEDGEDLPPESVGEIRVRGPGVMRGYYRQPRETAAATDRQGYLRTGDIGMVDEEGFLHIVGRREDVMIRGGSNVHAREVEDRLLAHPAVERGAVVGISDEILGEAICACVVRVEGGVVTESELRSWCALALAEYKVPDLVTFMEDLPLTGTGRVWRHELARRVSAERPRPVPGEREDKQQD